MKRFLLFPLGGLIACVSFCDSFFIESVAAAQDSAAVRQQFREFYEPLLPQIEKSYSNVRFEFEKVTNRGGRGLAARFRGALRGREFVFDGFLPRSYQGKVRPGLDGNSEPKESGGEIEDYCFYVRHQQGGGLEVRHNQSISKLTFVPFMLTPVASIQLRQTFAEIANDEEVEFLDFTERNKRNGQVVKSLFYRPAGYQKHQVFEADFNPKTGGCVSTLEYAVSGSKRSKFVVFETTYSRTSDGQHLPAPIQVSRNVAFESPVVFTKWEPVGELGPNEISVVAYGFEESDLEPPKSAMEKATSGATNILAVIAIILVAFAVLVTILFFLIAMLAKRHAAKEKQEFASEADLPAEVPSDLSDDS